MRHCADGGSSASRDNVTARVVTSAATWAGVAPTGSTCTAFDTFGERAVARASTNEAGREDVAAGMPARAHTATDRPSGLIAAAASTVDGAAKCRASPCAAPSRPSVNQPTEETVTVIECLPPLRMTVVPDLGIRTRLRSALRPRGWASEIVAFALDTSGAIVTTPACRADTVERSSTLDTPDLGMSCSPRSLTVRVRPGLTTRLVNARPANGLNRPAVDLARAPENQPVTSMLTCAGCAPLRRTTAPEVTGTIANAEEVPGPALSTGTDREDPSRIAVPPVGTVAVTTTTTARKPDLGRPAAPATMMRRLLCAATSRAGSRSPVREFARRRGTASGCSRPVPGSAGAADAAGDAPATGLDGCRPPPAPAGTAGKPIRAIVAANAINPYRFTLALPRHKITEPYRTRGPTSCQTRSTSPSKRSSRGLARSR